VTPGTSRDSRGSATGTGPGVEPRCTPPRTRGAQRATAWSPRDSRFGTTSCDRHVSAEPAETPPAASPPRSDGNASPTPRLCHSHEFLSRKTPGVSAPRAVHDLPPAPPLPAHCSFDVRHEHSIARAVRLVLER
jgi:hypothetical protein